LQTWDDLEQLYVRHSRSVYRRAREMLSDDDAARDATHEVFMRVVRAGGKVPAEPTCTGWLHRVTTNLCLNQLRDRSRQSNLLTLKHAPETSVQPNGESRAAVLEILGRVPAELQEIAVYFFVDELTYDEIAQLLGVSRRTVSNRLAAFRDLVTRLFPNSRLAS
jgi:RNA polymerase sigma-70 factor (ECF subfamily)